MNRSSLAALATSTRLFAIGACLTSFSWAQGSVFDLADAMALGDGSLPGTGTQDFCFPANTALNFVALPGNTFLDGRFVPLDTGPSTLTADGSLSFDFSPFLGGNPPLGGNYTFTGPCNGVTQSDPSLLGGLPDYANDVTNHSFMNFHANNALTYDLDAIRAAGHVFTHFSGRIGTSCQPVNYFVLLDGVLMEQGPAVGETVVVEIPGVHRYLTLAIGDNDLGTIGCAHGYIADSFLTTYDSVLEVSTSTFSVGAPSSRLFRLRAGSAHAGRIYFLVGSGTGTNPGLNINGRTLPLLADGYFNSLLFNPTGSPFDASIGALDGAGNAFATWSLPVPPAGLAGRTVFHAYAVLDAGAVVSTSQPASLVFIP